MTQEIDPSGLVLSNNSETEGFDLEAGRTWIYPTNYAVRDYQYNIVQQALLKNTLVSLPTGLGKTFIAAVVMYNFFRWYPQGKVIFMAPTRPLVKQQIEACYDITAIPKDVTVELTGTKISSSRENVWKEKRVFFITPQILQNDLEKLTDLHRKIKCLVFDEAHKARGNHAYCEVIRKLLPHNKYFRVLALSATPGSNINDVLEVVKNLLISHLEFRTEESLDVRPYVFERNLTTVVVPLGQKLQQIRDDYLQILEYYTKTLVKYNVIQGNCGNLTKGKIFLTLKEYQQKSHSRSSNHGEIMKSLNICITLYHGYELLVRHGLRSFLSFFDEHADKPLLRGNTRLIQIMNDVREYLGPEPLIEQLPDGSFVEIPKESKFGHPKFYKLRDILASHFAFDDDSSRVIVFFEYRNSVKEAYALLNQARPLLKPRIFLGQGQGITQRQQLSVIKSFREGECNILLSTCIGEEGLDVGDVDLIVCFDISNKSPIRMVQRMGRTGRKKEGRIIVLVTEGKEQQILKDCLIHKNNIPLQVLSSKEISKGLSNDNPRLVPPDVTPKCNKIYITIKKVPLPKKCSIKDMFRNISNKSSEPQFCRNLQIVDIENRIPKPEMLWNKGNPMDTNLAPSKLFSKKLEKLRSLHPTHIVKHSLRTQLLVDLLQHVDSKRFNIPITQIGHSQLTQSRNLKQSDIRNMFLKSQSTSEHLPQTEARDVSSVAVDSREDATTLQSKKLVDEISNYLSIEASKGETKCRLCPNNFDCNSFCITAHKKEIIWPQYDESVYNITLEDIQTFFETQIAPLDSNIKVETTNQDHKDNIGSQCQKEKESPNNSDVDLEYEICTIPPSEKTVTYEAPKTLDFLLNKYSTSIIEVNEFTSQGFEEKNRRKQLPEEFDNTDSLSFFKLNTIKDLFQCTKDSDSQETIIYSPDIIENSFTTNINARDNEFNNHLERNNVSPVLCTFERARSIKNFQRKLFSSEENPTDVSKSTPRKNTEINKPNLRKLYSSSELNKQIHTPSKLSKNIIMSSSTPMSNKETNNTKFFDKNIFQENSSRVKKQEMNELKNNKNNCPKANTIHNKIDITDLCDLSIFGLSTSENAIPAASRITNKISNTSISTSHNRNLYTKDVCDLKHEMSAYSIQKNDAQESCSNKNNISAETNNECRTNIVPKSNCSVKNNLKGYNSLNKSGSENCTRPTHTQISITQMIDLINEDETTPQKENIDVSNRSLTSFSSRKSKIKKKRVNPFIESQAELSISEDANISEDEEDEDQNLYDASFIDDDTQHLNTQIHINYLQSTRSPRKQCKFKVPQKPTRFINVYSQEVEPDDTYLDDSFVVHDETEEVHHELSELEILEEKLKKKKRKPSEDIAKHVKRKRIKQILSDDSD